MELRDYQKEIITGAWNILREHGFVYLALEMRLGKTLISLTLATMAGAKRVLFVTKKKALGSIEKDYKALKPGYHLTMINYESLHKVEGNNFDVVIIDEAHSIGQFPKPNNRCATLFNKLQKMATFPKVIYLSGTPTPESYSQMYHQFAILGTRSPWAAYKNFYKWAGNIAKPNFVKVREKMVNGMKMNDYTNADIERVEADINKYRVTYTQAEAGFESRIKEEIITIPMPLNLQRLFNLIRLDGYYRFKNGEEIVADTPVKALNKLHQISSGTIITEEQTYRVLDDYKARYIAEAYRGKKIAVFYKFISEGRMLKDVFGSRVTEDPEQFNQSDSLVFISQIQSGSMGINLSTADILVFLNIDFSATQYYQARARLGSMERTDHQVIHWIFSDCGVEGKVYQAVQKKKSYTVRHYQKDYNGKRSSTSGQVYRLSKTA